MKKYYIINTVLVLIIFSINYFAPKISTTIYNYYTKKTYVFLDYLLSFFDIVTISIGDLLYSILILFLLFKTITILKQKKYKKLFFFYASCILIFLIVFQISWGFNNYKTPLVTQLNLNQSYSQKDLENITFKLINKVNSQAYLINNDSLRSIELEDNLENFNTIALRNFENLPKNLKETFLFNTPREVKQSLYSKLLSYMGFSGYFNPFTHESQINYEIPTIGKPVTVAHEITHQLGVASESEANFIAFMVISQSSDMKYVYAGNLYALKYCLKEYRKENEEIYLNYFNRLHPGVQKNILESEDFWKQKRSISSFIFKNLYGSFLKMNNQKDGIKSYNKFVDILINYDKKHHNI